MSPNLFDVLKTDQQERYAVPAEPEAPPIDGMDESDDIGFEPDRPEAGNITLRPYQQKAVTGIYREWNGYTDDEGQAHPPVNSTLLVLPTGTGKTVCIAEVIKRRPPGKVMFVAHRSELIYQGKTTIEAVTGAVADIEKADLYAGGSDIVIATVQTLCSGMGGDGRMIAFQPEQFSLLIYDEAHHSTSSTWMKVHEYFKGNPRLKMLGVTATPDRADEEALGKVFESVAFDYELPDAIHDGWLVPITAQSVYVAGRVGLAFRHEPPTAGKLEHLGQQSKNAVGLIGCRLAYLAV